MHRLVDVRFRLATIVGVSVATFLVVFSEGFQLPLPSPPLARLRPRTHLSFGGQQRYYASPTNTTDDPALLKATSVSEDNDGLNIYGSGITYKDIVGQVNGVLGGADGTDEDEFEQPVKSKDWELWRKHLYKTKSDVNSGKKAFLQVVVDYLDAMEKPGLDYGIFCDMVNKCVAQSNIADLKQVVTRCSKYGIRMNVHTLTQILQMACKRRRWMLVAQLLAWMHESGWAPSSMTHCVVVAEMAKAKEYRLIKDLCKTERVQLNKDHFNAIISGCSSTGDFCRAFQFYETMITAGLEPNVLTYNSLIGACKQGVVGAISRGKRGQNVFRGASCADSVEDLAERAFGYFEEMKTRGIQPDEYCFNTLMAVCIKAGQFVRALEVFRDMGISGVQQDLVSYNTAITAYEKLEDPNNALALLDCMLKHQVSPDQITFNTCISACSRAKDWERAVQTFNRMDDFHLKKDTVTYNTIISACARSGQAAPAISLLDEMTQNNVPKDHFTYGAALHACMLSKNGELAVDLMQEMEVARGRGGNDQRSLWPNTITYGTAIHTCVNAGMLDEAMGLYERAAGFKVSPNRVIFLILCKALAEAERTEELLDLMDDMYNFKNVELNDIFLEQVLKSSCGKPQQALDVLKRMTINYQMRVRSKTFYHALVAACRSDANKIDDKVALEMVMIMRRQNVAPTQELYRLMVSIFQRTRQWEELLRVFEEAKLRKITIIKELDSEKTILALQEKVRQCEALDKGRPWAS